MQTYRRVLAVREVRRVLLLGFAIRIPMWAGAVILTLHVVSHLGRSYAEAGLVTGAATVALAVSGPWRGRRLDRVGLRRTIAPSLVVLTLCWCVAPFAGYWVLLALATVAGLFVVPTFSIVRQALMHATDDSDRTSVLSIDSVVVELSFMIGPALGVLLATYWSTPWAMLVCELASVLGSAVLWLANPALRSTESQADPRVTGADSGAGHGRGWLTAQVAAVLVMAFAATLVLSGTDVTIVAALRAMRHQSWIGWVLALWGLGSAVGGVVYGALARTPPVGVLVALVAATTVPVALAPEPFTLAALLFVAGVFCAPSITATIAALSGAVEEGIRGEALGWHGSAMTAGSAAGAPLAGVAIDHLGWQSGFVSTGLAALGLALAATWFVSRGGPAPRRSTEDPVPADQLIVELDERPLLIEHATTGLDHRT